VAAQNFGGIITGSASQHRGAGWRILLAQDDGVCWTGISGGGRLHGSGKLGNRSGRRCSVWLLTALGNHDFQSDVDPAAALVRETWGATGRDLAQACRDHYSRQVSFCLWILCEITIAACDLAEVIGSAIGLELLFGIPLVYGCVITGLDVMIVLFLQNKGFRFVEALVVTLIVTIGGCFLAEIIFTKPDPEAIMLGFLPSPEILNNKDMLFIAIGILGATVMPHNLYLPSSVVQTRNFLPTPDGRREAIKFGTIDSSFALMFALFINGAILVISAAVFHWSGHQDVAEIQDAFVLFSPLLGVGVASTLFALALLASGQNSTLTGTLAGQIVMEGFLNIRLRPWLRRLITRAIAIVPAVGVIGIYGESKTTDLLIWSQVILSLPLGFAVIPLIRFTSESAKMGEFVNPLWIKLLAWPVAITIVALNAKLLFDFLAPESWQHLLGF
jgi:manganese transport protein